MTVDWSRWMTLSPSEQQALWETYRAIVREESEAARYDNYRRLNRAIYGRDVER